MPLHTEREPVPRNLKRLGHIVTHGPTSHDQSFAHTINRLMVVGRNPVCGLARRQGCKRADLELDEMIVALKRASGTTVIVAAM